MRSFLWIWLHLLKKSLIKSFHFRGLLNFTLRHGTKSIDDNSTGVAKRLKEMCSNDNDFLEYSKKYSTYPSACNEKPKEIVRAFEKINNQPKSAAQQKRSKSNIKPAIFTKQ